MPDLADSESEAEPLPGNVEDDPEFSGEGSSEDDAVTVPVNRATVASLEQPALVPEPEPTVGPTVGDTADFTVHDDPGATAFLADASNVFRVAHSDQVSNFFRQRTQFVADVFREELRHSGKMFHFD